MLISELPSSTPVVSSCNPVELAVALSKCLGPGGDEYYYYDVIKGASCSGRIFYREKHGPECVAIPESSPQAVADQLIFLADTEARYDPPQSKNKNRGWEIRATMIRRSRAAIVWACWV